MKEFGCYYKQPQDDKAKLRSLIEDRIKTISLSPGVVYASIDAKTNYQYGRHMEAEYIKRLLVESGLI